MASKNDYIEKTANVINQKYVVGLAFAILKLKPNNVSTHDFCEEIQNYFKNKSHDEVIATDGDREQKTNTITETLESQNLNTPWFLEESANIFTASQKTSKESSQMFDTIKSSFNTNTLCKPNETFLSEFEVIQTVTSLKKSLCYVIGNNPFDEDHDSQANQYSSQDSGYKSSQGFRMDYRKKHLETNNVNRYLTTLTYLLKNKPDEKYSKEVMELVIKVYTTALDELYKQNIYLSFYDTIIHTLEDVLMNLKSSGAAKPTSVEDMIFKFNLLNMSHFMIDHSLGRVTDELQISIETLLKCDPKEAFEINDPDTLNYIFYLFHIVEVLLKRKRPKISKTKVQSRFTENSTPPTLLQFESKTNDAEKHEDNIERFSKLMSHIVLKCSDSYPLIAFHAMECQNLNKQLNVTSKLN